MTISPAPLGGDALLDELFSDAKLRTVLHPIRRTDSGEILGHEALMRGPRGTPYEAPPLAFAMAATLDLLEDLDCRCLARAARVVQDGLLFLNVHPRTLQHDRFWQLVSSFGGDGIRPAQSVVFEIVEHSANDAEFPRALKELRSLGFSLAVDDLGEGSAGLRRVIEVAPEFAKIDRFFISGIDRDPKRRAVVGGLVNMSEALSTRIIAEGVERPEELEVLRDLGVELVQGFLFGLPMEIN